MPRDPRLWAHLFIVSTVMTTVPFVLFGHGELHVSSVEAAIWNATTPLCTLLFTIALLKEERPTLPRIGGLVLGFLGAVLVLAAIAVTQGRLSLRRRRPVEVTTG